MLSKIHLSVLLSIFCLSNPISSSAQTYIWSKEVGGSQDDEVLAMNKDENGNLFITGVFEGACDFDPGAGTMNLTSSGAGDIFLAKYDSNGDILWAKKIGGSDDDEGHAIVFDASGNIYLTGFFGATADFDPGAGLATLTVNDGFDIFIAKYDSNGNYVWAKGIGTSGTSDMEGGSDMKLDAQGNIYLTGQFEGVADFDPDTSVVSRTSNGGLDAFFAKYDNDGNYQWDITAGAGSDDYGYALALDVNENPIVTGQFASTVDFDPGGGNANLVSNGSWDIYLAKYDTDGNYLWANNIGGTADDNGSDLELDSLGNIYLCGWFGSTVDFDPLTGTSSLTSGGSDDIFLAKYDDSCNYIWAIHPTGPGSDVAFDLNLNSDGNPRITGQISSTVDFDPGVATAYETSVGGWDIFFAGYDALGTYQFAARIGGSGTDQSQVILCEGADEFFIAGEHPGTVDFDPSVGVVNLVSHGVDDAYFAKYSSVVTGLQENVGLSSRLLLYPNPVSSREILHISLPGFETAAYELFDLNGKQIMNGVLHDGRAELDLLVFQAGIYYIRVNVGDEVVSGRISVLK